MQAMTRGNSTDEGRKRSVQPIHRWVEGMARVGYAAKGLVYLIVGLLAAQAALHPSDNIISTTGALRAILRQPFGKFLLSLINKKACKDSGAGLRHQRWWRITNA